jgi:hypothetical protein
MDAYEFSSGAIDKLSALRSGWSKSDRYPRQR